MPAKGLFRWQAVETIFRQDVNDLRARQQTLRTTAASWMHASTAPSMNPLDIIQESDMTVSPRVRPLDEHERLLDLLVRASGDKPATVFQRLRAEAQAIGEHVQQEMQERGIKRYEWSDELVEFYQSTDAFLYECVVWNSTSSKAAMRQWIAEVFQELLPEGSSILCYGDGLGIDSVFLAQLGYQVTYVEPSEKCQLFAREVMRLNDVSLNILTREEELTDHSFDAIVCLDVLEHVPDPPDFVRRFDNWLKERGMLCVHAPFFYLHPRVSTHLRMNRKYSGDWRQLYGSRGFYPIQTRLFWNPLILRKGLTEDERRSVPLAVRGRLHLGQVLLKSARVILRPFFNIAAKKMVTVDRSWRDALEKLAVE